MAASSSTDVFDVLNQTFILIGQDGVTEYPVYLPVLDHMYTDRFAAQANYGSQIGASIMMLVVYLLMTPRAKFRRVPTIINILALLFNILRCVLLAVFPQSQWFEFYTLWTGDISLVPASDYRLSVTGTVSTIPVTILIEAALIVQAWAMIQLWPAKFKWPAIVVSALISTAAVAFKIFDSILQALFIVEESARQILWVRKTDIAFSAASIFWFCFLFNIRLAVHMWKNRSILPSVKGMSAMEVLVMTNGILMCVPGKHHSTPRLSMIARIADKNNAAFFCGLEFGPWTRYEFGSLTYTSVVLVLPLGTLVAQRIANPSAFTSPDDSRQRSPNNNQEPFLKSWHSTTVSSRIEGKSNSSQRQNSVQDDDPFAKYEGASADVERGVRVARKIEHHEEMRL